MSTCSLSLPSDIPWTLVAVSPDMMDTKRCDATYPYPWRSSLAIYAYEVADEDIPEGMCDVGVTYIKVACSITGYQPNQYEISTGLAEEFPDVPTAAEYLDEILDDYWACYGALVNVAVFPYNDTLEESEDVTLDFTKQVPGTTLTNPYTSGEVTFAATGQDHNEITDNYPQGGDGAGELSLFTEMVVTVPTTSRVEASVVHYAEPVTMEAYNGDILLGSQTSGSEQGTVHELAIEGENINKVIFKASQNEAVLLKFTYVTTKETTVTLSDYPHIVDIEPKTRDLYQAATEEGEVLTSSNSNLSTGKSSSRASNTQTDLGMTGSFNYAYGEASSSLNSSWGTSKDDTWSIDTEASRERRETQSTTTQISQLYNLLTGYHTGTNRALFLMLARPHTLQPTDMRTFAQGVRYIEGIQDFFLIVVRPKAMSGLCVQASLDTGHYPEDTEIEQPDEKYDTGYEDFDVVKSATGGATRNTASIDTVHSLASGWVVDRDNEDSDAGHAGMQETANNSNAQANDTLSSYNYGVVDDYSVSVTGEIRYSGWIGGGEANFDRSYRVFTRSEDPINTGEASADTGDLLITSRSLCGCFKYDDPCIEPVAEPLELGTMPWIADEWQIKMNPALYTKTAQKALRSPATKEFMRKVQRAMSGSRGRSDRHAPGDISFLDTDNFKTRLIKVLPKANLEKPLSQIQDLPDAVRRTLGDTCTVGDALKLNLRAFASKTRLPIKEAVKARRRLLGRRSV